MCGRGRPWRVYVAVLSSKKNAESVTAGLILEHRFNVFQLSLELSIYHTVWSIQYGPYCLVSIIKFKLWLIDVFLLTLHVHFKAAFSSDDKYNWINLTSRTACNVFFERFEWRKEIFGPRRWIPIIPDFIMTVFSIFLIVFYAFCVGGIF